MLGSIQAKQPAAPGHGPASVNSASAVTSSSNISRRCDARRVRPPDGRDIAIAPVTVAQSERSNRRRPMSFMVDKLTQAYKELEGNDAEDSS